MIVWVLLSSTREELCLVLSSSPLIDTFFSLEIPLTSLILIFLSFYKHLRRHSPVIRVTTQLGQTANTERKQKGLLDKVSKEREDKWLSINYMKIQCMDVKKTGSPRFEKEL